MIFQATLLIYFLSIQFVPGDSCKIYENTVGKNDQDLVKKLHNNFRRQISEGKVRGQPKAKNLGDLSYDAILAKAAQEIANTCVFEHVSVTDHRYYVGQNLYISRSSKFDKGANWTAAVTSWFNEHLYYNFGQGFSSQTGHYTQLVWADTKVLGCGYTFYYDTNPNYQIYPYAKLYVCNYGPWGNVIGQNPYNIV